MKPAAPCAKKYQNTQFCMDHFCIDHEAQNSNRKQFIKSFLVTLWNLSCDSLLGSSHQKQRPRFVQKVAYYLLLFSKEHNYNLQIIILVTFKPQTMLANQKTSHLTLSSSQMHYRCYSRRKIHGVPVWRGTMLPAAAEVIMGHFHFQHKNNTVTLALLRSSKSQPFCGLLLHRA